MTLWNDLRVMAFAAAALAASGTGDASAGNLRPGVTPLRDRVTCSQVCVKGLMLNRCESLLSKAVTTSMVQPRQHC
jgi:hypothetical protein